MLVENRGEFEVSNWITRFKEGQGGPDWVLVIVPSLYRIEDSHGETVRLMNHNPAEPEFCRRIANEVVAQR